MRRSITNHISGLRLVLFIVGMFITVSPLNIIMFTQRITDPIKPAETVMQLVGLGLTTDCVYNRTG
jgi:hypothetical protein